eukprot:CAMPEP_0194216634 /NCGR_PEP_ID=MMETSP0156-20130528/19395_1 /TAXON_ID=33649 /ORGANISM="Thalassionema nitzschioides, Strain L26-B" /LENGTH=447 /DNA_ID=CAMNT_0038945453 /DNA_START=87 /DNA_END=1430 /DNA_ORIENTATION=-
MVKENDGKALKRKSRFYSGLGIGCVLVALLFLLSLLSILPTKQLNYHDDFIHSSRSNFGLHGSARAKARNSMEAQIESVLQGESSLIEVSINYNALSKEANHKNQTYGIVYGTFCPINWELQKKNPSLVAMYRELIDQSNCNVNQFALGFREISRRARSYDNSALNKESGAAKVKQLAFGGVAFHESRCGSTLVANLLSASSPEGHRVYSESHPPITVLKACSGSNDCSRAKQAELMRDVIYMMSRSANEAETHVFFKIQSIGSYSIPVFENIFPNVPWIFVYRDPVEVLSSHLKRNDDTRMAACLRGLRHPAKQLQELVPRHGREVSTLTNVEFCAAHLASLCEAALLGLERASSKGLAVNYASLPGVMWETVLPQHFDIPLMEDAAVERMQALSGVYSKGFRGRQNKEWIHDSKEKQERSSSSMREAADLFMQPYYNQLEAYNSK